MHNILSLSRTGHSHLDREHVYGNHESIVLSYVQSLMLLLLIRIKQQIVGWDNSVLTSV